MPIRDSPASRGPPLSFAWTRLPSTKATSSPSYRRPPRLISHNQRVVRKTARASPKASASASLLTSSGHAAICLRKRGEPFAKCCRQFWYDHRPRRHAPIKRRDEPDIGWRASRRPTHSHTFNNRHACASCLRSAICRSPIPSPGARRCLRSSVCRCRSRRASSSSCSVRRAAARLPCSMPSRASFHPRRAVSRWTAGPSKARVSNAGSSFRSMR